RTGNKRQRALSRAAHLRQPYLPRLPSPDAALCLPALGGDRHRNRRAEARLGETEQAPRLRDAAGRCAADLALDGAAVERSRNRDWTPMRRSMPIATLRRFLADQGGATA